MQITTLSPMPNADGELMNAHAGAEQGEDQRDAVHQHDAEGGEDDRLAEAVGDLDDAGAVEHEHHRGHGDRGGRGLEHDAVLERLVALGDAADREPEGEGVHRGEVLGPHRPEVHPDRDAEADEDAEHRDRRELGDLRLDATDDLRGDRGGGPADGGRCDEQHEQHRGAVDDATNRHPTAPLRHRPVGDRLGAGDRTARRCPGGATRARRLRRRPAGPRFCDRLFVEDGIGHGDGSPVCVLAVGCEPDRDSIAPTVGASRQHGVLIAATDRR